MGIYSTIVIYHDAIPQITKDPNFTKNLLEAIHTNYLYKFPKSFGARWKNISGSAGIVLASQHADDIAIFRVGGKNTGELLHLEDGDR